MDTTTTESAAVAAEEILTEMTMPEGIHAEVLSSSLASTDGHAAHLVVWGPARRTCDGCGQSEWPVERSCPVNIDSAGFGDLQMWNHQHGCGVWWSPPWAHRGRRPGGGTSRDLSSWEVEELVQTVREA